MYGLSAAAMTAGFAAASRAAATAAACAAIAATSDAGASMPGHLKFKCMRGSKPKCEQDSHKL